MLSSASGSASLRTIPSHSQEWEDLNSFEVSSSFICFRSVSGSTQLSRQSSSAWSEVRRSRSVELSSACRVTMSEGKLTEKLSDLTSSPSTGASDLTSVSSLKTVAAVPMSGISHFLSVPLVALSLVSSFSLVLTSSRASPAMICVNMRVSSWWDLLLLQNSQAKSSLSFRSPSDRGTLAG